MSGWNQSFHALGARLQDAQALQCKICGAVYDPEVGDAAEGIEAGTPFSRLPESWRCPQCDAPQSHFLPLSPE